MPNLGRPVGVVTVATNWDGSIRAVADRLGYGMDALWAVLYAAQHAALALALDDPPGDDRLTRVGMDLADALAEVESVRPELAHHGIALALGTDPDFDPLARRAQLATMITGAGELVRVLTMGNGDEPLDTEDLLGLTRTVVAVAAAYATLTGQLRASGTPNGSGSGCVPW